MKDRSKAKKRVALSSLDIHVGWIVGVGVLTAIFLLATFATAYRHDVYSSSLGLRDLVSTDVWFRVFLALTCFSLLLFLGLLVYAFLAGRIGGSGDSEEQELHPTTKTSEVKGEAPAVEEKAPAIEQPERVIIDTARLRDIFNSEFMHERVREGKTYLDQVIDVVDIHLAITVHVTHELTRSGHANRCRHTAKRCRKNKKDESSYKLSHFLLILGGQG